MSNQQRSRHGSDRSKRGDRNGDGAPHQRQDTATSDRRDDGYFNLDLTVNGRLFPTWAASKFKHLKLPPIMRDPDEDPCKPTTGAKGRHALRNYQKFIGEYLAYNSPYKRILLYHGLGAGKSATIINLYNILYHHNPNWNIYILIRAALRDDPWMKELKTWMRGDNLNDMYANIHFIHYDSPFAGRDFLDEVRRSDASKQNMYIIDEAHNFILNTYSNMTTHKGQRAQVIYDHIQKDVKETDATRVILVSATPAVNTPFELALIFNLLRPGIFPKSESEFNEAFMAPGTEKTLDSAKRNQFQRLIIGLVSYYIGTTPDTHATSNINYIDISMERYQNEVYRHFEELETRAAMKGSSSGSMYRSYTRQACNFVFPDIDHTVTGMKRPRPSKYRLSMREAQKLIEGQGSEVVLKLKDEGNSEKIMNVTGYMEAINQYVDQTTQWFWSKMASDTNDHTIFTDLAIFKDKYKKNFFKFYKKETKKSKLFGAMYMCSPKFTIIVFNVMTAPGPTIVYSNYVKMEGLQMFKLYLELVGFTLWQTGDTDKLTYGEFHGDREREDRRMYQRAFNEYSNRYGQNMKVLLFSPAGSEGVSLRNVRQIHLCEPHWHEVRILQMIGRGIRQCSHADLPLKERHVEIFRYRMVRPGGNPTTDEFIESIARSKQNLIESFLEPVRSVAVDCEINRAHNMMSSNYKCFTFDLPSIFDKNPGPAFRLDPIENSRIDNGLNAQNSQLVRIKALRVKAVKQHTTDKTKFGNPRDYWWYPDNNTLFDFELMIPVAKALVDATGAVMRTEDGSYVIDQTVSGVHLL